MPPPLRINLFIEQTGHGLIARIQAERGLGAGPVVIDLDSPPSLQRANALDWVRAMSNGAGATAFQQASAYGRALFEAVLHTQLQRVFDRAIGLLKAGQSVHLALHLPPELAGIPWELLHADTFLVLDARVRLVRQVEWTDPVEEPAALTTPRVVVVVATPFGVEPFNADREIAHIEQALASRIAVGQLTFSVISGPDTWGQLRTALRRETTIVHFLCHSRRSPESGESVLVFADPDNEPHDVDAETLRQLVQNQRGQLRLAVVHACRSALGPDDDPFHAAAYGLIRGGVPAVIATQFELSAEAAARMAGALYTALAEGMTVEDAVADVRIDLRPAADPTLDWVTPVHLSRIPSGPVIADIQLPGGVRISHFHDCFRAVAEPDRDAAIVSFVDIGARQRLIGAPGHPSCVLAFGAPGSGKTTHRHAAQQALRSRMLVIELDNFGEAIDAHEQGRTVRLALLQQIREAGFAALAAELRRPQRASAFLADEARMERLWVLWRLTPNGARPSILDGVRPERAEELVRLYRRADATRWLETLHEIARDAGFEGLCVMVDGLDDDQRAQGNARLLTALLWPLLGNRALLLNSGITWRFFLPDYLLQPLRSAFPSTGLVDILSLDSLLTDQHLRAMLDARVAAHPLPGFNQIASPITRFADLCMPDLREVAPTMLVAAAGGSPRRLMRIAGDLVAIHLERGLSDTSPITRATIEEAVRREEERRAADGSHQG